MEQLKRFLTQSGSFRLVKVGATKDLDVESTRELVRFLHSDMGLSKKQVFLILPLTYKSPNAFLTVTPTTDWLSIFLYQKSATLQFDESCSIETILSAFEHICLPDSINEVMSDPEKWDGYTERQVSLPKCLEHDRPT